MTSTKKICVCGKDRGKEPVVITITTCKNKHTFKVTQHGQIEKLSAPLATSSPIDVTKDPLDAMPPKKNSIESFKSQPFTNDQYKSALDEVTSFKKTSMDSPKSQPSTTDQSLFKTAVDESVKEETISNKYQTVTNENEKLNDVTVEPNYQTALEISEDKTSDKTKLIENTTSNINETTLDTTYDQNDTQSGYEEDPKTSNEDANATHQNNDTNQEPTDGYDADSSVRSSINPEKTKDVFFVTETAVNTIPYLDPLLNVVNSEMNKDGASYKNGCGIEIYIFEKHIKDCKHKLFVKRNTESVILDKTTSFQLMGKMTFPSCCDDHNTNLFQHKVDTFTEPWVDQKQDNKTSTVDILTETPEKYNFVKALEAITKSSKTFKKKISKYLLSPGDDSCYSLNNDEFQENKLKKKIKDQSCQFEYTLRARKPRKWFHGFLECLGLKDHEEFLNERYLIPQRSGNNVLRQDLSSSDIRNYLVI